MWRHLSRIEQTGLRKRLILANSPPPPKMEGPFVYESIRSIRCEKGKPNVIKRSQKPEFRSLALADWFARRQNPSFYNKLVTENAVIQVLYIDVFAPGWAPSSCWFALPVYSLFRPLMLIVQRVTYIAYNLHDGKLIKVKKDILSMQSVVSSYCPVQGRRHSGSYQESGRDV